MRSTKSSDDEDIDDFSGFLDEARAARAKQFRDTIRSCKTDDDKYNLCLDKRDKLIEEQDMLEIEFSCYDKIFSCSNKYKASKMQDIWRKFTATASRGSKYQKRIKTELEKVASAWGVERVEYYSFRARGINFAIRIAANILVQQVSADLPLLALLKA